MSTNEVTLFGVLAADTEIRSDGPGGARWALLKVETFNFVRDPQTKKPVVASVQHEVHCFDELSVDPLSSIGKKGYWIRVRGNLAYRDNRQAYVRVPVRGGQATVSHYFGDKIRPDVPFRMLVAEAIGRGDVDAVNGLEALHSQAGATLSSADPAKDSAPVVSAPPAPARPPVSRPIGAVPPRPVPRPSPAPVRPVRSAASQAEDVPF